MPAVRIECPSYHPSLALDSQVFAATWHGFRRRRETCSVACPTSSGVTRSISSKGPGKGSRTKHDSVTRDRGSESSSMLWPVGRACRGDGPQGQEPD